MSDLPRSGNAVTAAWLMDAMSPVLGPVQIDTVAQAPLADAPSYNGTFTLAAMVASSGPADMPVSVVVKMVPGVSAILELGRQLQIYRREALFYEHIAPAAGINVARCFGTQVDPETGDAAIVLEDLTHLRTGNQVTGFSLEDAHLAVIQYARLHARWWKDDTLSRHDWLPMWNDPAAVAYVGAAFAHVWQHARTAFADLLGTRGQTLGDSLTKALPTLMDHAGSGPVTLLHGDARHDNLMFADDGSAPWVVDWQFAGRGRGMVDIAYYLCQGGDTDLVAREDEALVRAYHDALVANGVADYDFDTCWADYRRFALYTIVYPVFAAGLMDPSSKHQREAVAVILKRAVAAADRLGVDEFLTS